MPFTEELGQNWRLLIWGNEVMLKEIEFFLKGPVKKINRDGETIKGDAVAELKNLVESFEGKGDEYEVFAYRAQHKVLDDLGYSSVKVCVPALIPLYLRENFAPLGANRIKRACEKMGDAPAQEINIIPHPFP